ncbi:RecB-like helicase [Campylobacter geochelonis]|uniref:DNA 3'-5' helicase n=1 Tax=Campylobacter geochelonis TaxID=1780362 RepID=A0A128EFR4_9BACT|nr:RecB-like helicase [Campylobacter geochelonis]QKF71974.1 AddAB recombination complex, helicase AddA [Campylobacter geochelonis]CZE47766.1 putative recombination protein RecB [Campylobacter geochelonis]
MQNFLALKASAGSGKTFALSARFVALILSGVKANQIMALTFTNKAANEMKDKIITLFLEFEKEPYKLNELCKMLNLSPNEVIKKRDELQDEFLKENLKISTFDAFFSSILRSFALNFGINSNFAVESDKEIKNLTKKKFIDEISKEKGLLNELASYILSAQNSQDDFFNTLENIYENIGKLGILEACLLPSDDNILDIMSNLAKFATQKDGSDTAVKSFLANRAQEVLEKSFLSKDTLNYKTYSKIYEPVLDVMFDELKEALREYCVDFEKYKLSKLSKILEIYKDARRDISRNLNVLTFSDIAKFVHTLLVEKQNSQMLYFRLDARINHLLIDEFQDTNITQYEILKPLIDEILAGYGQNGLGSFFYVGDTKQSIYKFRGAKKELFDKLMADYKQINLQQLNTNYRSDALIVEFVNELFDGKIKDYTPQNPSSKNAGFIKVLNSDESVAKSAAKEAHELIKSGAQSSDITILCWKNKDIDEIKQELLTLDINASGEGANLLFNTPFVRAVIEYAKFCLTGEQIYRLNTQNLVKKDVSKLQIDFRKTTTQTVLYLIKKLDINLANADITNFIELSKKYTNIIDLVFSDDDTLSASKDGDGVKLMTVHKSKGLQFPHLIVCDKFGSSNTDRSKIVYEYDVSANKWEIALKQKYRENVDENYANFLKKSKELNKEEDLNKLYVALTRAEHSLIIVKNKEADEGKESFFNQIVLKKDVKEPLLDIKEQEKGEFIPYNTKNSVKKNKPKTITLAQIPPQENSTKDDSQELDLGSVNFGLALHYTLESLDKFDKNSLQTALIKSKNKFAKSLDKNAFIQIEKRVNLLLESAEFSQILAGKEIYKELPFKINGALKQLDVLLVGKNEICVVDYKSSVKFIEENKEQVLSYKEALGAIYQDKIIKAYIIYLLEDEIKILKV